MPIIIKEMHVKATVTKARESILTEDVIRKLKRDIIREIQQSQKIRNNWQKER